MRQQDLANVGFELDASSLFITSINIDIICLWTKSAELAARMSANINDVRNSEWLVLKPYGL